MNQPNRSTNRKPDDPSRYDMYATFRTKERAQLNQKRKTGAPSYYEGYQNRAQTRAETNRRAGSSDSAKNTAASGARQNAYRGSTMSVYGSRTAQGGSGARQTTGAARAAQHAQNAQKSGQQNMQSQTGAGSTQSRKTAHAGAYGTRVQSAAGESYRYGFHSSYRTSDGRILDGFDKTGRPIYRDPYSTADSTGTGGVILHGSAGVQRGERRLHPARRVRIETLADTEAKPFPFRLLLTVLLCTSLVMTVLYTYMELNKYTTMLSTLSYRLSALKAETNTLSAEVVRREDLISIEQTASEILGMVKTDVLTKQYVSIENEDKTEVVSNLQTEKTKRITVEIDLDTGKPVTKTEDKASSFTPADQTQTTSAPANDSPAEQQETTVSDSAGTDTADTAAINTVTTEDAP